MKTVNFKYQTKLAFPSPVFEHHFSLKILPQNDGRQHIKKLSSHIEPLGVIWNAKDGFDNAVLCGHIEFPHEHFSFGVQGTAEVSDEPYVQCREPERILLYPSELTKPDNKLIDLHKEIESSAPSDTLQRVQHFAHAVHTRICYERGATTNTSTASEAFSIGAGVCQDYAHILLSLLRQSGIHCRYVAGLASDYGETHAWVEAWIAGRYLGIDPTRDKLIDEGYIAISRGRDFEDASVERGVFKGSCTGIQTIELSMEIR